MNVSDQHRAPHQQNQQQHQHKRGGGATRRGASTRGSNANASGSRSRDYGPQTYATWAGSSSGMRSYSNYRTNPSSYGTGQMRGPRHRYPMELYNQAFYDDYSYDYNYPMDGFVGQWHPVPQNDRSKQSQQPMQNRREGKKGNFRDRTTQNRSSAPPAGSNERNEGSQSQQQASQQPADSTSTKPSRREQSSRVKEAGTNNKNASSSGKARPVSKKQGSTESNTSSTTELTVAKNSESVKIEEVEKPKEAEEKSAVQLQPAPVPTVNVWNTKHPLIANAPAGTVPPSQEGIVVTDLMTINVTGESRTQVTVPAPDKPPKPLMAPAGGSQGPVEEKEGGTDTTASSSTAPTAEARRGRESSKSRRERAGGRQGRGDKRVGSGRRGGSSAGGSGGGSTPAIASNVSQNSGSNLPNRETNDGKNQPEPHTQSTADDSSQRNRKRNKQKGNVVENVESQMVKFAYFFIEYLNFAYLFYYL